MPDDVEVCRFQVATDARPDRTPQTRHGATERSQRFDDVVAPVEVLESVRMGHARFGEEAPAFGLRAVLGVGGVGAVRGDAELHRKLAVVQRRHERHQMGPVAIRYQPTDSLDEPGAVEQFAR